MTTGRPLTAKCLSTFWPAANEASGIRSMPALITGRSADAKFLRIAGLTVMLVHAPAAVHHRGQNLCLLLIGGGKIIARDLIIGIFLQTLAALLDKGIQGSEIFAQRVVNGRNAGHARGPDGAEALLFLIQTGASISERFCNCAWHCVGDRRVGHR